MTKKALIEDDGNDYSGEYVTVADRKSTKVITHGRNVVKIVREAKALGYANPVLIYVEKKDVIQILYTTA